MLMDDMKNFRKIADEIMKDINVTDELKQKTLAKCKKKKVFTYSKLLVPAACVVLILGIFNISGIMPNIFKGGDDNNSEFNIMMEYDTHMQIPSDQSIDNAQTETNSIKVWEFQTIEEAKEMFGEYFLTPSYIPSGFNLNSINGFGQQKDAIDSLQLNYVSGEKSFTIVQNKNFAQDNYFTNYKSVDINGVEGYIKSSALNTQQDSGVSKDEMIVELHWIANNVHYMVSGAISESDAISIAKSMK